MDLRHLRVLRAIALEGSLAAAARSLHYSQPTITHHLASLESHFGARLVQRGSRGATLTEVGEALLPHAEAVLGRLQLAEKEVRDLVQRGASTLRIGTFPTAGALLLPPAVRSLHAQGVELTLTEGELPLLLDGLRSRELHVALIFSQPGDRLDLDLDDDIDVHPLLDDPLLLVLPVDHPCARLARVPLEALRDETWIVGTTDWDPCDRLLTWACRQVGYEPVHALRTDDYGVIQGFVAAGAGIALLPRLALGTPRDDIAVRQLDGPPLARRIAVATLSSTTARSAGDLLVALRAQAERIKTAWA